MNNCFRTTAGAIGSYGRFVSGGAQSDPHGGGGSYGKWFTI
jgi:hypothetical protein